MPLTVEKITEEALKLPASGRASVLENLLASLAGEINSSVERAHLDEVGQRREAVRVGGAKLIDGAKALREARARVRK